MRFVLLLLLSLTIYSCNNNNISAAYWSEDKLNDWYTKAFWQHKFKAIPSSVTDKREFSIQVQKNPKSWQQALDFLCNNNLRTLAEGTYKITCDGNTFAIVSNYETKDSACFEAHRKYIDLQYVISGREKIKITSLDDVHGIVQPYNDTNDIEFYQTASSWQEIYTDSTQLVFLFPNQVHLPGIKVKDGEYVKKVVIKIPYIR